LSHRFFSAARASGTFVDPEQEQQLGIFTQSFSALFGFYTKLLSFILIFSAIRRHSSVPPFSGPTQTRASLSVGLPVRLFVCLFVCLFRSVCFFVSLFLQYSDQDSDSSFIHYIVCFEGADPL